MTRAIRDLIKEAEKEQQEVRSQRKALEDTMIAQTHRYTERYRQLQRKEQELDERICALRRAED